MAHWNDGMGVRREGRVRGSKHGGDDIKHMFDIGEEYRDGELGGEEG